MGPARNRRPPSPTDPSGSWTEEPLEGNKQGMGAASPQTSHTKPATRKGRGAARAQTPARTALAADARRMTDARHENKGSVAPDVLQNSKVRMGQEVPVSLVV